MNLLHDILKRKLLFLEDSGLVIKILQDKANTLACSLIDLGVKPGDRVALLAPNRPEWIIATFAIAKIGAITSAISTFSTPTELSWTLKNCSAVALITVSSFKGNNFLKAIKNLSQKNSKENSSDLNIDALPNLKVLISLDKATDDYAIQWDDCMAYSKNISAAILQRRQEKVSKNDLCYILYTSGSTAEPKGVTLAHGNVIANGYDIGRRQNLSDQDILWFAIPLFWSFGSANALPAIMTHGGSIVLQESFEPAAAIELIEKERCTVFYGMVNMARSIRESDGWSLEKLKSMRTGLTIGLPEDIQMIIDTMSTSELCNVYGSTETYGNASVCSSTDPIDLRLKSQGLPLPGMKIRMVDPETKVPLPSGEIGEITVAGYVTPGYFNAPELTAQTFDKDGYFLTGDLGIIGKDGRVYFKGRLKEIIKTGGVNVSPLEVEGIILKHPNVKQAFVLGVPHKQKTEAVTAVVELKTISKTNPAEIIDFCRNKLASYKVPLSLFIRTNNELPRTSTGKINKPALRQEIIKELSTTAFTS
jgi:fatty-acyl-CoA synthase